MEPTSEVGVRDRVRRGSGTGPWVRVRGSLIPSPGMAIPGSRIRTQGPGSRIPGSAIRCSRSLSIDAIDRRRCPASTVSDRHRTIANSCELTRALGDVAARSPCSSRGLGKFFREPDEHGRIAETRNACPCSRCRSISDRRSRSNSPSQGHPPDLDPGPTPSPIF